MIQFKNYISELFDKPLSYKMTRDEGDWRTYEFSIKAKEQETDYVLYRDFMKSGAPLVQQGSVKQVRVSIIDYDHISDYEVDFKVDGSRDITGLAGTAAIKIFTTVVAIILDFIKKIQPNKVQFMAVKTEEVGKSRTKLYDRMTKRLTPKGYKYSISKHKDVAYYIFTKTKK